MGLSVLAAIGFLFVLVSLTPLDSCWATLLAGRSYFDSGEVLVVLGGSEVSDGAMGWNSYLRAWYACRSYRAGRFRGVVIMGGPGPSSNIPESIAMGEFLRCQGVPADVTRLETSSLSTRGNVAYSRELLNTLPGRKVLPTSDYHMLRARRAFAKLGVQVLPEPIPDVKERATGWQGTWPAFLDLLEETCKVGYYWARGWI
jgi:uncharacterized SAM-binding protein YcdF (DUF218 family)